MRIVYVLTSLGMGGAERQALALARRMEQRGHAVSLLVLRPRLAEEWPTELPRLHLDLRKTPASACAALLRAGRFLRDFRPDLVHSHCFHANVAARVLRLAAPAPAVLSTVHNVYEGGWLRMIAYRATDRLSWRTIAVSEAAARRFIALKAVPAHKCGVAPNGIEIDEFVPDPARRRRVREQMGAGGDFVWIAAGRIAPAKDYPTLLRAFARARQARQDFRLWIAGEAPGGIQAAGSNRADEPLRQLAAELGLEESIEWLGLRRDLADLFDAADGFVMSSRWEGMPLVLGEAMAMGKSVVATDVGGVREMMGDAGIAVPASDSEALAQAMLRVMSEPPEARAARGQAARLRIAGQFGMEARADEWERIYAQMVGSR